MSNFLLLIADIWVLTLILLFLHYRHPRYSFAPFLMFVGALTVFIQSQLGVYIEPLPGILLFLSSNGLVPVVIASVLILYVTNGAVQARLLIGGILGIGLLVLFIQFTYRQHLLLPTGGQFAQPTINDLISPTNLRVLAGSLITFAADMFVIAVFYQGIKNHFPNIPEVFTIGLALLASMWTDALLFRLIADLGTGDFIALMPGDVLGKTISALILWPLVAVYLLYFAPRLPDYMGGRNRPTLDLVTGSLGEIKQALSQTKAALQESEQKRRQEATYFDQIANHITEALWLTEPEQIHAYYVNPAYEKIWGRTAASLYADPLSFIEAIHPEDKDRIIALLPTQSQGNYDVEYRIVRPDGAVRWVRDRAFPIQNEGGTVYRIAGISEDITERKQLEKRQLDLAVERERVRLLRDFINEASHDLKSPLTAINLKIHRLMRTDDPEKRQTLSQELLQLSERIGKMVEDLLTLARLENKPDLTLMPLNLQQMILTVWEDLRSIAEEKDIQVVFDLVEEQPLLEVDPDDLERALANLIDNGLHYTPPGGTLKVVYQIENEVIIKVSDTGIGISKEDIPHIFNRFYRATNAQRLDPGGTGLGLSIVRKVVEQHRGRIELVSTLGIGTTFTIRLPRADGV
ncbi:MAG: PAS domain-containing protein [Anaerolineae bacterium]|nr:PAS domain-containing protein [Anaerolineae bacterium]